MRKRFIRGMVMGCVIACIPAVSRATLVAEWNFNSGTSADLTSTNGLYTFTTGGSGGSQTIAYSAGTVSLGGGESLTCTTLNSTSVPTLTTDATIYLRVRFEASPASFSAFAGLTASPTPPSGYTNGVVMGGVFGTSPAGSLYEKLTSGNAINPGSSLPAIPVSQGTTGSFTTIAVVYSSLTDVNGNFNGNQSQGTIYVNGTELSSANTGTALATFADLAVGRVLSNVSAGAQDFDDIQVYDEALTSAQITAIGMPEPGAFGLSSLLLGGFLFRRRTRVLSDVR